MYMVQKAPFILFFIFLTLSCDKDDSQHQRYEPIPVNIAVPAVFSQLLPEPQIPSDNPLTQQGVLLGRALFFERRLSADNSLSCAGCHRPNEGFSDQRRYSIGIDGVAGFRNSMPIVNIAWNTKNKFNWDGSANSLEEQVLEPVTNEIEMHNTWANVVATLQNDANYLAKFEAAFGSPTISKMFFKTLSSKSLILLREGSITRKVNSCPCTYRQHHLVPCCSKLPTITGKTRPLKGSKKYRSRYL